MERDFTAQSYDNFCTLIDQINDEQWCGITDWFGDCFFGLKHLLQDWGWLDRTNEMDKYYRELLDRKNVSRESVTQVYEDISRLDKFSSQYGGLRHCRKQLWAYRDFIQRLKSNAAANPFSRAFSVYQINQGLGPYWSALQENSLPLLPNYQFTASSFGKISTEEKDAYISQCDALRPDLVEKIDLVLSDPDFTDDEKRDIKFLIYSGPEPYRSIYLEHIDKYDIAVFQKKSEHGKDSPRSFFTSDGGGKIWLTDQYSTFRGNLTSPYNTVFHESGHAIDYFERTAGSHLSKSFELDGNSLYDCIVADTRNYVSNLIDRKYPMVNEADKELLLASLNLSDSASFQYGGSTAGLSPNLLNCYQGIQTTMFLDLFWLNDTSASDVYGGVTNQAISGGSGHPKDLFQKGSDYNYWYNKDGETTKDQAVELWAEFFAAKMTHDEEELASIKEHFPTAYPMLEEMALKMATEF